MHPGTRRVLFGLLSLVACTVLRAAPIGTVTAITTHRADPLFSVDQNRQEIVERLMTQWQGEIRPAQRDSLRYKLAMLRADRLLAASLVGTFDGVLKVLGGQEAADRAISTLPARSDNDQLKQLGDGDHDLVYTPLAPCRLFDTRAGQPSALGQLGGAFAPNTSRTIVPAGACAIPTSGVNSLFVSFTTLNNTPASGGYISMLAPAAPLTTTVDIFNLNSQWSASNTIVATGAAGQFVVYVSTANAHVVVDVLGYFAPPPGPIGDITEVNTGTASATGLTGGTTSGVATLSLAPGFKLPQACSNNQSPRYNTGTGLWECVTPAFVSSVATGLGLSGGPITSSGTISADTTYLQRRVSTACAAGSSIRAIAADCSVTCETVPSLANVWTQGGNAFGAAGLIGTTDAQPLTVQAGGNSVSVVVPNGNGLRIRPGTGSKADAPSVANGSVANLAGGTGGATVGGGGYTATDCFETSTLLFTRNCRNFASGDFSVIAGGYGNQASATGTISGGTENTVASGGGSIGGGSQNTVSAANGTVSGGLLNIADGLGSVVPGGVRNQANGSYSTSLGRNAIARNWGQVAHAGNGFGTAPNYTPGTSQYSRMVLSYTNANGTTNELLADGTTASANTERRLRFFANQSAFIDATVFAKQTGAAEAKAWSIKCIVMVDAAGAVTLSPSPCVPTVMQQSSPLAWNVTVDSLTVGTDGVIRIRQTGVNGIAIRWVATVHMTELLE